MLNNRQKTLLISVPYLRNIRHSLSVPFTTELKKYGKIVVISPFKISKNDLEFIDLEDVSFIHFHFNASFISKYLIGISDYARRSGYFSSSKDHDLPYYFKNLSFRFNKSGYFEKLSMIMSLAIKITSLVFRSRYIWKIFENFVMKFLKIDSNLEKKLSSLDNVVYLQSANWGIQDRILTYISESKNWKSLMIPYTSDQIFCTGHLLKKHDIYAVQSELEKRFAMDLHNIPEEKIKIIGSIWFRNIEYFSEQREKPLKKIRKKILYAGVSSLYFPKLTEIKSLEIIADEFQDTEIHYCPYISESEFFNVKKYFKKNKNVTVIPHSLNMTELKSEKEASFSLDMMEHLQKIAGVDVFIMSYLTSMSVDTNFISKCPIVANFIDDFGILKKRNTDAFPKNALLGKDLMIVKTYEEIVDVIRKSLSGNIIKTDKEPYLFWDSTTNLSEAISGLMGEI